MKAKTFSITINGDRWKYRLLPGGGESSPQDWVAHTEPKARAMTFMANDLGFGVVVHELLHAHCRGLYLNSSSITFQDYEEIIAEMLEEKILVIVEQANKMLAKMKEYQDAEKSQGVAGGDSQSLKGEGLVRGTRETAA